VLLIYDGKCGFCKIWIDYWRKLTGDRVEHAASQEVGEKYPQISKKQFTEAVQLVREDGTVASGARAVFETLGYKKVPFAPVMEWGYRVIAGHRDLFYHLTKWTFGLQIEPARFALTQWVFVRLLAVVYAIAFGSLTVQVTGLLGAHGVLPVGDYFKAVAESAGGARYVFVPSVFWMNYSDGALVGVCWAGVAIAVVVMAGFFERAGLAILFVLYLSLSSAGQEFLSFQWDSLLLEAGFLAIFLGNARVVVWLFRWLLFRLMFMSGAVKLLSHDKTWRDLSALSFHYWTQPLPNRISWYMEQLPEWFQRMSTAFVLGVEVGIPFLIFAPRRLRIFGAKWLLILQVLIFLTGNYTFFNLLAMALCVFLFDDRSFERSWWTGRKPVQTTLSTRRGIVERLGGKRWRLGTERSVPVFARWWMGRKPVLTTLSSRGGILEGLGGKRWRLGTEKSVPVFARWWMGRKPVQTTLSTRGGILEGLGGKRWRLGTERSVPVFARWEKAVVALMTGVVLTIGLGRMIETFAREPVEPLHSIVKYTAPLEIVNSYGLFAMMTTARPEIIVEGSMDGDTWRAYSFRYKPGDLGRAPRWVEPHQPRLDWQMWFAALGNYRENPWFVNFAVKLLEGSPEVRGLLEADPFGGKAPQYVRAVLYEYSFTDAEERRRTGNWWKRDAKGLYLPAVGLKAVSVNAPKNQ
jgi:predicted DCC family thiol-disulfide oxidoreductase YuxK